MDAIDILGGLLGRKTSGAGAGAKILRDILAGGSKNTSSTSRNQPTPETTGPADMQRQARELEDLLNVSSQRRPGAAPTQTVPPPAGGTQAPHYGQPPQRSGGRTNEYERDGIQLDQPLDRGARRESSQFPSNSGSNMSDRSLDDNAQALILVRAMVHATKADGKLTPQEQQQIFQQIGDSSPQAIELLRSEFAKPVNVRDFAWSVPIGMEQKVYTISLIAIDLDTTAEANYLRELAHGLRLSPDLCNQIHLAHGVQAIFE